MLLSIYSNSRVGMQCYCLYIVTVEYVCSVTVYIIVVIIIMSIYIIMSMHLFSVEVMYKLSVRVAIVHTDSSPPLIPLNVCDSVIPESSRYPLIWEPSQDQSLICDLRSIN